MTTRTLRLLSALSVVILFQQSVRSQSPAMELVSVNIGGTASGLSGMTAPGPFSTGDPKFRSHVAGNGRYVVFESNAFQLVCTDLNTFADVYVRDRHTGANTVVSLTSSGLASNNHSFDSGITPDGRYVVFGSQATNLVSGDTNGFLDVFVRDREAGTTERVSVSSGGAQGDMHSFHPTISADGRYISFVSFASNLVAGDTNNREDVFVHDRQTLTTERVSVTDMGGQAEGGSHSADVSADGRYVAFTSTAGNLFPGVNGFFTGIFVRDRLLGTTTLVSVNATGGLPNLGSREPAISADGRYIAYSSNATDIVVPDANNGSFSSVFLHDRQAGTTELVGVSSGGAQGDRDHRKPSVSADGRIVVFMSWSTNLVPGDTNDNWDLFRRDRLLGTTERISLLTQDGSISADGRAIYLLTASQLAPNDTNTASDVYVLAEPVPAATPGISLSAANYDVAEASGPATITVTRTGNVCTPAGVNYATADDSATGGQDYVGVSGTLTFAAGETTKTFQVPVTDDSVDEPDETVTLSLTNASGAPLGTAAATLTILDDDAPANAPPQAGDDAAATHEDTAVIIAVLANDIDADGDPLTINGFVHPANGSVTDNGDGTLTYTPGVDFHGVDTFTYVVSDGRGGSDTASVQVTVTPVNDTPVAANDHYATNEDTPLAVAASGVLANDSDVEGDPLSAMLVAGPAHGIVALNANGSFSYAPGADFFGVDSFTYRARDAGGADSGIATVTIVIAPVDETPLCNGRPATIFGQTGLINGTPGDDVILGSPGPDTINAGDGNDTICGGGGDDMIEGGLGHDWLAGDAGNDTLTDEGAGSEVFDGGDGIDTVSFGGPVPVQVNLWWLTIQDTGRGSDRFASIENLIGSNANDWLAGNNVVNMINGVLGDDYIFGSGGDDTLIGGRGNDVLDGSAGDDQLVPGLGNDHVVGSLGIDTVSFAGPIEVDAWLSLIAYNANGEVDVLVGVENAIGSNGNDRIRAGIYLADPTPAFPFGSRLIGSRIEGGFGNDILEGNVGADVLLGGPGSDTLFGDHRSWNPFPADDLCDGGAGVDGFAGGSQQAASCEVGINIP